MYRYSYFDLGERKIPIKCLKNKENVLLIQFTVPCHGNVKEKMAEDDKIQAVKILLVVLKLDNLFLYFFLKAISMETF
jgi:hypothetical protein